MTGPIKSANLKLEGQSVNAPPLPSSRVDATVAGSGSRAETVAMTVLGSESTATTPPSHFDVVLLDIQMKRMNGDEVCRRLRALGLSLPIIATTGTSPEGRIM